MTGTHGIGVSTPQAAAVAEATVGFAMDWHMPKGRMFAIGTISMILPMGLFWHSGRIGTVTMKLDGAIPNEHRSIAPIVTKLAIV